MKKTTVILALLLCISALNLCAQSSDSEQISSGKMPVQISTNASFEARLDAVRKIGETKNSGGARVLKDILKNKQDNWNIRLNAARSLAKIEAQDVIDVLIDNLANECEVKRVKLSPPVRRSFGTEDEIVEKKALAVLVNYVVDSQCKKQHLIRIMQSLKKTHNQKQKYYLSMVMGKCGDKAAVPMLIKCLERSESGLMRADAARILGVLGDQRAISSLKTALRDNYVCISTGDVIGKSYGHVVRRAAVQSLKQLGVKIVDKGNDNYEVLE